MSAMWKPPAIGPTLVIIDLLEKHKHSSGRKFKSVEDAIRYLTRTTGLSRFSSADIEAITNYVGRDGAAWVESRNFHSKKFSAMIKEMELAAPPLHKRNKGSPYGLLVVSTSKNELPFDQQMDKLKQAGRLVLKCLNVDGNRAFLAIHEDTGNLHLHIIYCRYDSGQRLTEREPGKFRRYLMEDVCARVAFELGYQLEPGAKTLPNERGELIDIVSDEMTRDLEFEPNLEGSKARNNARRRASTGHALEPEVMYAYEHCGGSLHCFRDILADSGIEFLNKGSGAIFVDPEGRRHKASKVNYVLSRGRIFGGAFKDGVPPPSAPLDKTIATHRKTRSWQQSCADNDDAPSYSDAPGLTPDQQLEADRRLHRGYADGRPGAPRKISMDEGWPKGFPWGGIHAPSPADQAFADHGIKIRNRGYHLELWRECRLIAVQRANQIIVYSRNTADLRQLMIAGHKQWGTLQLTGNTAFKNRAADLAAELGIPVANPELKARIEGRRQEMAREHQRRASASPPVLPPEANTPGTGKSDQPSGSLAVEKTVATDQQSHPDLRAAASGSTQTGSTDASVEQESGQTHDLPVTATSPGADTGSSHDRAAAESPASVTGSKDAADRRTLTTSDQGQTPARGTSLVSKKAASTNSSEPVEPPDSPTGVHGPEELAKKLRLAATSLKQLQPTLSRLDNPPATEIDDEGAAKGGRKTEANSAPQSEGVSGSSSETASRGGADVVADKKTNEHEHRSDAKVSAAAGNRPTPAGPMPQSDREVDSAPMKSQSLERDPSASTSETGGEAGTAVTNDASVSLGDRGDKGPVHSSGQKGSAAVSQGQSVEKRGAEVGPANSTGDRVALAEAAMPGHGLKGDPRTNNPLIDQSGISRSGSPEESSPHTGEAKAVGTKSDKTATDTVNGDNARLNESLALHTPADQRRSNSPPLNTETETPASRSVGIGSKKQTPRRVLRDTPLASPKKKSPFLILLDQKKRDFEPVQWSKLTSSFTQFTATEPGKERDRLAYTINRLLNIKRANRKDYPELDKLFIASDRHFIALQEQIDQQQKGDSDRWSRGFSEP